MQHPRNILLGAQARTGVLPVCDHYSGAPARMRKSLLLQAELIEEFGACVFDVTLDCEDGAPTGGEVEQAHTICELLNVLPTTAGGGVRVPLPRVGARVHAVDHSSFASDIAVIVGGAAAALSYLMVPKVESVDDVEQALQTIDAAAGNTQVPLHVLIESPAAVQQAFAIAAHPRVESLSFGLMDFVSAHSGAIPGSAMGLRTEQDQYTLDQFHHPLVRRAKLEIASACHAHGKVPSHCVVTELRDAAAVERAARYAATALGFTRMWSIHPDQIRPILRGFAPLASEVDLAARIVQAASQAEWAPIAVDGTLHDRASYRYFWQVLERAHRTGQALPAELQHCFV
ncbi:MAG: aldolase/citrate lyase family protein [Rhodoferax sp.]|nr:aldolase/citrate lyase family protein [Rhodoferax sp.]